MPNDFLPIKSSNLAGARFNPETGELDVTYQNKNGGKITHFYRYSGFPPKHWEKLRPTFQTEESTGKLLRGFIAGLKYELIEEKERDRREWPLTTVKSAIALR